MPFVATTSGVNLHFESKGEGRPLVLVHGWSMSGRVWRYQVEALSSSHKVITIDLRGHGDSSAGAGYSFEDFAEDLIDLFNQLDLSNSVLIAWSMGVQVAIQAFASIRHRLAGLVFIGGTPKFTASEGYAFGLPPAETRSMTIRLKRNYLKAMGDFFHAMFAENELSRESYQRIVSHIVIGGRLPEPEVALKSLDSLVSADLRPLLSEIDVPVLLIHGEKDTITLPLASEYMARHIPTAGVKIVGATGHAPFMSHPERFNSLLLAFLEGVYGGN